MTATNPRDRATVQNLLRTHVPSGFPQELAPLTVGDVACRLVSDHQIGADRTNDRDLAISRQLVTNEAVIPDERMTGRRVKEILAAAGLDMTDAYLSDRYWIAFQRALIVMLMARNPGPAVVFACERQETAAQANPRIETIDELNAEQVAADAFATDMRERERIAFRAGWLAGIAWQWRQGRATTGR